MSAVTARQTALVELAERSARVRCTNVNVRFCPVTQNTRQVPAT